jgi:MFS family permease
MTTMPNTGETSRRSIFGYVLLSGSSGVTAGMLKVIAVLFAIRLGANSVQVGIISGMESLFMALMTIPAGLLVSRFGARNVYVSGSLMITLVYIVSPQVPNWYLLAIAAGLGGACMPFRMVALNGSFMERLKVFGEAKAGWYRAAGIVGTLIAGPSLATSLFVGIGVSAAYWGAAALFAAMGVIGFFQLPRHPAVQGQTAGLAGRIAEIVRLTRHPVVAQICMIELSSGVVFAFFTAFIVLFGIKQLGLSDPAAVSVRFAEGIVSVGTMVLAGAFLARQVPIVLYRWGVVLNVAGFVLLGFSANYAMLVASALLLGIGFGTTQVVNVQRLSRVEVEKGKVASLQLLSTMGGTFLGAALGGVLAKDIGFDGMFFSAAAIYAVLSIRWCFERRPNTDNVPSIQQS